MLLALQILSGTLGSQGYCLALLALRVLSGALGSLGITGSPDIILVII